MPRRKARCRTHEGAAVRGHARLVLGLPAGRRLAAVARHERRAQAGERGLDRLQAVLHREGAQPHLLAGVHLPRARPASG